MTRVLPLLALLVAGACGPPDRRPDVLLVVLDAVRADHVSAYGYARPTTPRLDALAAEGVLYRRALSAGTWTVPGHASLFTGRLPSAHGAGFAGSGLHPSVPTLADRLRAAGWDTAAFAANAAYLDPAFGLDRGFRLYQTKRLFPAARLADRVTAWLRDEARRPAFVFLNVLDAHGPYAVPAPYDRLFPGKVEKAGDVQRAFHDTGRLPDAALLAHCVSQYDGALRYMDDQLGRIFDALVAAGRWDDAMVIVTADHGDLFGEHDLLGHGTFPWDPVVRVPLIVKYPHGARRGVVDEPVSLTDVAPTVLATLGLPPLGDVDGVPLGTRTAPVVVEWAGPEGVMVRAAYDRAAHVAIARTAGGTTTIDGYDLARDPGETTPVADAPWLAELGGTLDRAVAALGDVRGPVPAPDPKRTERLRALGYVH